MQVMEDDESDYIGDADGSRPRRAFRQRTPPPTANVITMATTPTQNKSTIGKIGAESSRTVIVTE